MNVNIPSLKGLIHVHMQTWKQTTVRNIWLSPINRFSLPFCMKSDPVNVLQYICDATLLSYPLESNQIASAKNVIT